MRKKTYAIIFFAISLTVSSFILAQEDNISLYLNNDGMTIDSLYDIVNNPKIPYKEKMKVFYRCNFKRETQQDKQLSLINTLLSESKQKKDMNGLLYGYVFLADLHNEWNNNDLFNLYIDSADLYAEQANHSIALAAYHYTKGSQAINEPYGKKEGYKQFETAINYYSKSIYEIPYFDYILYNITIYIANQPDTTFTKRLIGIVEDILQTDYSPFIDFSLCTMKSDLYSSVFYANRQESKLDSAIFYEKKRIGLFETNRDILPKKLDYDILQSFLLIAEYCSMKNAPDWAFINDCIEKAKAIEITDDAYILSRINYTEAISLFEQGKYFEAEKQILNAEQYLSKQINEDETMYPPETFYSDEIAYADLHGKILVAAGRYKEALVHNKKMNDLRQLMRQIETRELEYLYNTEKEEKKIEQLIISNTNRIQSTSLLIITALLLVGVIALLFLWFYAMKKNAKRRSVLIKTEKEEAELNLKIKEEQAIKAQLEKYEILSDFHIKEIELEGKNKAMEQLIKDKKSLDNQIDEYLQKINEYELDNEKLQEQMKDETHINLLFLADIAKLINKKISPKSQYIELLKRIDGHYVYALRNSYNGNLSIPYIKYCICFAIGMEIAEVSECFSIEQSSVHMVRYRLKKKFGLNNNEDLDVFLRQSWGKAAGGSPGGRLPEAAVGEAAGGSLGKVAGGNLGEGC